jgi:hypothetical protein
LNEFNTFHTLTGPLGNVVDWGIMLQAGGSQVWFPMISLDFSVDLIFPAALWRSL